MAPAAKVMLVAMLVTLARGESKEEPAADPGGPMGEPLLRRLAALSLAELERLAETGALRVVVSCGREELSWSLQASARRHAEQALLEYFVRHGAPRTLLRALFTVSRARVDAVRKSLRVAPAPGRPKLPRPREREAIVAAWAKLEGSGNRRARYHTLHRMFPRYSIATLDLVLREVSPNERSQLAALETGRRPSLFPRRQPGGRRRLHQRAIPSCTVVSPSERWQPSRPLLSDAWT